MNGIIFTDDGVIRCKNDSGLPFLANKKIGKLDEAQIESVFNRIGVGKAVGGGASKGSGSSVVTFEEKRRLVSVLFVDFSNFKHGPQASISIQPGAKSNNGCILFGSEQNNHVGNFSPHTFSHCPKKMGENRNAVLDQLVVANASVLAKHAVTKELARAYFTVVT